MRARSSVRRLLDNRVPLTIAALLVLAYLAVVPEADQVVGPQPAFFALYAAVVLGSEALTAAILLGRALSWDDARAATLGAVYACSTVLLAANVVSQPTFGLIHAGWQLPPYLWIAWHIAVPIGMMIYAAQKPGLPVRALERAAVALAVAVVLIVAIVAALPALPELIVPTGFLPPFFAGGFVAMALDAVAIVVVLRSDGSVERVAGLHGWIALAAFALFLDIALTLSTHVIFSVGTYAARVLGTLSGLAVLAAIGLDYGRLLLQVGDMRRRADDARREADAMAQQYARERRIAAQLQRAFLPPFLPDLAGVEFDATYRPAAHEGAVGGDWYDAFALADGRIAISVGDVTGHGLDAAAAMVRAREVLRAVTLIDARPDQVLELANRSLLAGDLLATAVFGVLDPERRFFEYACAGHPAPILRHGSTSRLLEGGGAPLGMEQAPFETHGVTLMPGDCVALYTDGLIENERRPVDGEERLLRAIAESEPNADAIVDAVIRVEQRDDVALLLLRVGIETVTTPWRFSSDDATVANAARSAFVAHLEQRGFGGEDVATAELVFGELIGNVVRHAPGPIQVEVRWSSDGRSPLLVVRDRGPGFVTNWEPPADVLAESGRGLFLVHTYAVDARVASRAGGGSEVRVRLREGKNDKAPG